MKSITAAQIKQMDARYRANFINCLSGFKSANLIGTQNQRGEHNLAVFSSVFHLGAHPPLLGMIIRPHTVRRDTLENIRQSGSYTINHVHKDMIAQAHQTSARYEQDQSEFAHTGLTPWYSGDFSAPYVKESRLRLGMELREIQHLAINQTELVIGEVNQVHIEPNAIQQDGFVDLPSMDEVAIGGLDGYYQTDLLDRFEYAKTSKPAIRKA